MKKYLLLASLALISAFSLTGCADSAANNGTGAVQVTDLDDTGAVKIVDLDENGNPIETDQDGLPEMSPANQEYYDKYLSAWGLYCPFERSYTAENFADQFSPYQLFYSSLTQEGKADEYSSSGEYPAELVESVVTRHFPVTAEQYRAKLQNNDYEYYDPERNIYYFAGGVGGGEYVGAVTDAEQDGDELRLGCSWYNPDGTFIFKHTVTIVLGESEYEFYYASNERE